MLDKFFGRVSWVVAGALSFVVCACSAGEHALPDGSEEDGNGASEPYERCEEGQEKECHITLALHGDVVSCFVGTQVCGEHGWGACLDGDVVAHKLKASGTDKRLLAVTHTGVCVTNPCDPKCELFGDVPDAAVPDLETITGTSTFDWKKGSIAGFPAGLVKKGLIEPCSSGADCQFNTQCTNPASGGCSHGKCEVGLPLEPSCDDCVTDVCAANPQCCVEDTTGDACEHDFCKVGTALKATCSPCVKKICDADPSCCNSATGAWSASCVQKVTDTCGLTCSCCDGQSTHNGRCYVKEGDNKKQTDAKTACVARGTGWNLASIADAAENTFVYNLNSGNDTWIGLEETGTKIWTWPSGDPSGSWNETPRTGIYAKFSSTEPNHASDKCAYMLSSKAEWADQACNSSSKKYDSICEGPPSCFLGEEDDGTGLCEHDPCETGDALSETCDVCAQAICQTMPSCCTTSWTQACVDLIATTCEAKCECGDEELPSLDGKSCFYAERNNQTWAKARTSCQARAAGWDLASVSSSAQNDALNVYNGIKTTWIGMTKTATNTWTWLSGSPAGSYNSSTKVGIYQNFASGEPNGTDTCVQATANSGFKWSDATCTGSQDAMCQGPKSRLSKLTPVEGAGPALWSPNCIDLTEQLCDVRCDGPATSQATCEPWYPAEVDPNAAGIDLAVDAPCDGIIPVCNHGQAEAPAGIRLVHFPANSQQYPSCAPDQGHPQMYECFTTEPIPSGECISVTGCPKLVGNREIMVNPPGAAHVDEYSCVDNWSLFSGGSCSAPTCAGGSSVAVTRERPVDVIFVIDNSSTMDGEIAQVQERIYTDFASTIEASGVDYRVIMIARYGDTDTSVGFSSLPVCIPSPLGADDCSKAATQPLENNSPNYFHFSADVGSWDATCRILEGFDAPDELARDGRKWTPLAPFGYSQWLRKDSLKVFVAITDDDIDCYHRGVLLRDNDKVADGEAAATTFDDLLLALSPDYFGTKENRSYVWHSIIGMSEYPADPDGAWPSTAAIQTGKCSPGSEGPGTGYQALSRLTGGLRYPVCRNDDFDAIFQAIATKTVTGAEVACSFDLDNQADLDIDLAKVSYQPGDGSAAVELTRTNNLAACANGKWYPDSATTVTRIHLCPETCDEVRADADARVGIEIACLGSGFEPYEFSELYQAKCEYDERPQWSFFSYSSTVPGDSSITLRIRSASTEAGLASAEYHDLTVITSALGNQVCNSPAATGCPLDLYTALDGVPDAHYGFVEIAGVLTPTSDGLSMPGIDEWGLSYTCPDAQ